MCQSNNLKTNLVFSEKIYEQSCHNFDLSKKAESKSIE